MGMGPIRRLSCVLAAHVTLSCAGLPEYRTIPEPLDPFFIGGETVVMAPVVLPEGLEDREPEAVWIDSVIAQRLTATGYDVVPAEQYAAIWDQIVLQMGGLVDSSTGELDEDRFELARERLFMDLTDLFDADAVLYPEIWLVEAPFADGVASWDGTSENMVGFGLRFLDALGAVLSNDDRGGLPQGTVSALSLVLIAEDMSGREVFSNAGGIQLLEKVGMDADDVSTVDAEQLLRDWERNAKALEIVLGPLVNIP